MCGIAGWVDWKENPTEQSEVMEAMVKSLAHRGPDASGFSFFPQAALGHRRLIVVDPEGGGQPMAREWKGRKCTIVYNGELYNTSELRSQLASRGFSFQTRNSDTEVLLAAYLEWGNQCVSHLNGIYAFAIWNETEQSLFMSRDRLGVKPLFYCRQKDKFLFASELKALLKHPALEARLDHQGLMEILVMGPARTPGCGIFKGINELRPGFCLEHRREGTRINRYWQLRSEEHRDNIDETAHRVRYLLEKAVTRQLVADVPLVCFLSGGLDSSAISAISAREFERSGRGRLHTFSVDYSGNDLYFTADSFQPDSDLQWAGKISEYLGSMHHQVLLDNKELAQALIPSMRANDYPGMADIDSSLYLFCREVKKQATVVLSGECADEIFGGYPWFTRERSADEAMFPWIRAVTERMEFINPEWRGRIGPEEYLAERYREALEEVPRLPGEPEAEERIRQLFYFNITRFMPTLLDRKDRMSMAWGLEVRVPFADHVLLEYVWNIPWAMKACDGMRKGILRRALRGLLPDEALKRRKSPYPRTHHPEYLDRVRSEALALLDDPGSLLSSIINRNKLNERLLTGRPIFTSPWFGQLMRDAQYLAWLIQLEAWLQEYRVSID